MGGSSPSSDGPPTPEQIILNHLAVGAQYVADNAAWDVQEDFIRNRVAAQLRSYVLVDKVASEEYHCLRRIPRSPWQGLKQRHQWLRRLFGDPKLVDVALTVQIDRFLTYPDAAIRVPDLGAPVIFERLEEVSDGDAVQ